MSQTFDRYASIVFLAVGLAFVIESRKISASAYGSSVGPDIFPMGLGFILMLLGLRLFYETSRYKREQEKTRKLNYQSFLILLVSAVIYALLLEPVGYVLTTFFFLLVGFQVMERGGLWRSIVISGVFSYGVYYLFVEVLEGSLPGFPAWLG